MRLLLKISVVLVVLVAGLYAYTLSLPRQSVIKQTVVIDASPEQVFPYLNNPTDWKKWSAWNTTNDPSLIYMYGGPLSGTGARQNWSGDKTGNWHMEFTQSTAPDSINYELIEQGQPVVTRGGFILTNTGTGTQLTWYQTTPLEDTPLALLKGAWQKRKTEQEIAEGLLNLQTLFSEFNYKTAKK